ncbi:MAG TPA: hypothetical protein VFN55_17260 [Solirubrobacteraceae bacterium]|nr:hypothetical protein [Solirubrobacteraceae bacterium]
MHDDAIRALVLRLARPHRDGGLSIERAAIAASGGDAGAVEAWIIAHAGRPEAAPQTTRASGLHGGRMATAAARSGATRRFLLPREAVQADPPRQSSSANQEFIDAAEARRDHVDPDRQATSQRR